MALLVTNWKRQQEREWWKTYNEIMPSLGIAAEDGIYIGGSAYDEGEFWSEVFMHFRDLVIQAEVMR